jgi:hypothetical protein
MFPLLPYRSKCHFVLTALCLGVVTTVWPQLARSQNVRSADEISRVLAIEKLSIQDGAVSGEVHNLSARTVRDVQLLVRHTWLWNDEYHPGAMDPGTSAFQTLQQEIPPGGTARFNFTPSTPLAKAAGGRFVTTVRIAGFTEVIPPGR